MSTDEPVPPAVWRPFSDVIVRVTRPTDRPDQVVVEVRREAGEAHVTGEPVRAYAAELPTPGPST